MADDLDIDAAWYLSAYPDVAAAGCDPVEHYRLYGRAEGRLPRAVAALALNEKLWGGFSRWALTELRALFALNRAFPIEGSCAAWVLARWFAGHQDWVNAERYVDLLQSPLPTILDHLGVSLLRIEVLLRCGRYAEAESVWQAAFNAYGPQPDLCLTAANVVRWMPGDADEARLTWINRVFDAAGLVGVSKVNPALPLSLDNLTATLTPVSCIPPNAQPKISVIMPVYNAAPFIGTALRSLLAQTWTHFEVIVVDDASTDDTLAVVQTAVKDDPRVVIIQQPRNRGAYAARNAGLRRVTGEFITTHDADDWSHPQKLERLAATLLADASLMGVLGHWVRADTDLHFLQCWPTEKGFIHPTVSSFLFRRQALARLGGWDEVKVAGDSEFYERMMTVFGRASVQHGLAEVPLVFARQLADSLTGSQATHLRTQYFGGRRLYAEFYRSWHGLADREQGLRLLHEAEMRLFPVPRALEIPPNSPGLQGGMEPICYDQVLMADFGEDPRIFPKTCTLVRYLLGAGQRVALFHWPDYRRPVLGKMAAWYLARALEGQVDVLSPDDAVRSEELLIVGQHLLRHPLDAIPRVVFQRARVLALGETAAYRVARSKSVPDPADQALIEQSGLFDADWYWRSYPDVREAQVPALQHYMVAGAREGRNPGPKFNTRSYLARYPQAAESGWPPLLHYLKAGIRLGYSDDAPLELVGERVYAVDRPTILVCGHVAGEQLFGAERSLLRLLDGFVALGFNVLVSIPDAANPAYLHELQQRSLRVLIVPYFQWAELYPPSDWAVERFSQIIADHAVDAVHVNTIMLREPALAARRGAGIPTVMHVHESLAHDPDLCREIGLPAHEIRRRVLQRADQVIANSAFTARAFDKPGVTHRVTNTVDLAALDIPNPVRPGRINIALISSNLPKKGLLDFVALARLLAEREPMARFLLIGPENGHTAELRAGPLPGNLVFSGYAPTPREAISQANIVLNLSQVQETFGLTILEAMAARRPVLVYDWGALPELVRDGVNGFVLPFGEVAALAAKLCDLCRDVARIERMGEAGRHIALTCFGPEQVATQLQKAYIAILQSASLAIN